MALLECMNLSKTYDHSSWVVNGWNLSLPKGRILGLLGPNGCGKSTLIKMIAGVLQPTDGKILIEGDPVGEITKGKVAYLPERTYFASGMKVAGLISFFADFYSDFDPQKAEAMLRDLGIDTNMRLSTLSKGTKEKVQLVMVMARNASLYLLDEPIGGVDPVARDYVLQTVISQYSREASIIITTHLIRDVENYLDDFIFMGYGSQILMGGNVKETVSQHNKSLDELFREVFRW